MGNRFFYSHRCVSCRTIRLPSFNGLRCKLAKVALFIYSIQYWVECTTSSVIFFAYFTMVAHKGHYALFHNIFRIISMHLKSCTTGFEIFATHFEIFTTHLPQDPKCWQIKRNGYAAPPPPSFDAMFCSTCGQQLQESFVFCPKCGLEPAANVAQGSCDVDSKKNYHQNILFWQVLSTTPLLASLKSSTVFENT